MFDVMAPPEIAPEDLVEELSALFVERDRLESRIAELTHRVRDSEAFRRDGFPSVSALLRHRMSLHPGETQRLVARANGLAHAPLVALAHSRGVISGAQVDVLLEARSTAPDAFTKAESDLVSMALDTPLVRDLRRRLDYWLDQVAAEDLAGDRNLVREIRALTLRRDGEMIRINGWVDIETGERLRATLEPGIPADGDTRSTPARRADLLVDILNGASGRPDIIVHVTADTLTGTGSGISETSHGTFLTADEIRRLSCDANLTRVILTPESQPLDVGRTRRLVTPSLRAAVCARDLRCVFPNCDRPSSWCDVHHLTHWAHGGETNIDNLVLLCRHHHVLVHESGWAITGAPCNLRFHRPDGTELGTNPPSRPVPNPIINIIPPAVLPPGGLLEASRSRPRLRSP